MSKSITIGARVSPDLDTSLQKLAEATGRSKSWLVSKALEEYVTSEEQFVAAVQIGLDDMRAGRMIDHETVVKNVERRRKKRSR